MKLKDLVEQMYGNETLQVVWNDGNWNSYDIVNTNSPILKYYLDYTITKLTAIDRNVFRFRIKNEEKKLYDSKY